MRILLFTSDAFGARGGIAQYVRDMLSGVVSHSPQTQVVVLPRHVTELYGELPPRVDFRASAAGGKLKYVASAIATTRVRRFDVVICCHLNLLPLAALAARRQRARLVLLMYGIEVWQRHPSWAVRRALKSVDKFVTISDFTWRRFAAWAAVPRDRCTLIPCCVDQQRFTPGLRPGYLVARHGLAGKRVILTIARLAGIERYKGIDEVMEALPDLLREDPSLRYLVVGDGSDRLRLEAKARTLRIDQAVEFAGYVPEEEKVDYYRCADVFAMPGRGEGFGIVFLEALACGIPVVASTLDASQEAVHGSGLSVLVDPRDPGSIQAGLLAAIALSRRPEAHLPRQGVTRASLELRWREFVGELERERNRTAQEILPRNGSPTEINNGSSLMDRLDWL